MKIAGKELTPGAIRLIAVFATLITVGSFASMVVGCGDDNNRIPTKEEVKKADVSRQSYIDSLNIPESQKAAMKSHMGGPPVANPATAAQGAANQKDRR